MEVFLKFGLFDPWLCWQSFGPDHVEIFQYITSLYDIIRPVQWYDGSHEKFSSVRVEMKV